MLMGMIRIRPAASDEHARDRFEELREARGEDYASLSRMIGRPAGYLRRYAREGLPKRLRDAERRDLAGYFGVHECELGVTP